MKAIRVTEFGNSTVLKLGEIPIPDPKQDEVLVRVKTSGVNFIDIYQRSSAYVNSPVPPFTPGVEGSGVIELVGSDVSEFKAGDRVAWVMVTGSYAEYCCVPASKIVKVPSNIELDTAAAMMLQGITANYLTTSTFPAKSGQVAVVHAAAGGTGALISQMLVERGVTVIATTSTVEKEKIARATGAHYVVRYDKQSISEEVLKISNKKGVDVVYDGVGLSTFDESLKCLKPRGMMVLFGASSGAVPPFDLQRLNSGGSLYITRPSISHYIATEEELRERARAIFELVAEGGLSIRIGHRYPLAEAFQAHDDLSGRKSTGKLLLIP
ncbi:MAG: quinone oxidoreductase [Candidatus Nanopelagicaceae bacterium]|nr:quinone oxidoreductase [Candidatus Nanopelagicaceae bacterium]